MSQSSPQQNQYSMPSLLRLPQEILEEIVSDIDLHQDLLSIALVSRACSTMVIPHHTEYRIIRIRRPLSQMWAHLARRSDLTRNIREVHLCHRSDYMAPDHFPSALIEKDVHESHIYTEDGLVIRNLCRALGHMKRLQAFTWDDRWSISPTMENHHIHAELVLESVRQCASLKKLALNGSFGRFSLGGKSSDGSPYPVWSMSNLQSLSFCGDGVIKPSNATYVRRMLDRSPDLESLQLPMEFSGLVECHFSRLKSLRLPLLSGANFSIDQSRAIFISNHPTIEDLSWFPLGPVELRPTGLPAIKRLQTGRHVIEAMEYLDSPRYIEWLDVQSLDPQRLATLNNLDRASLQRLKLHTIGSLESIHHIAEMFPNIVWLSLPVVHLSPGELYPSYIKLESWLDLLPRFQNLEVFRGDGIWSAVKGDKNRMHLAILELVQKCPKLRRLDHCDFYDKRKDVKRIIIIREGVEGEHVSYEIQRPPPRYTAFDIMDGRFD